MGWPPSWQLLSLLVFLLVVGLPACVSQLPSILPDPIGAIPVATCRANSNATAALQPITTPVQLGVDSAVTINVSNIPNVGYVFLAANVTVGPLESSPNKTRGSIFIPEEGVDPVAYAPYARALALQGYFAIILNDRTIDAVVAAMELRSEVEFWVLGGHGKGGTLAARLASLWVPRVKGLVLFAAALPASLDLSAVNIFVTHAYGSADVIVPPETVRSDAARLPPDAWLVPFNLGHYDFAYGQCGGNALNRTGGSGLTPENAATVTQLFTAPVGLAQWFKATPRALSFSNNSLLTPGLNTSKPYPVNSTGTVTFQALPIPGTRPQRYWFVFSPPASHTTGGLIYYSGAAVDSRAYFPIAFEIAARGWLVVIVQQTARSSPLFPDDASTVLDSNDTAFAHVSKSKWAIGGHSAGGSGASIFALANPDKVIALLFHSSRLTANASSTGLPVVNVIGTIDGVAALGGPPKYGPVVTTSIEGGNHYQIGDYGYQYPDNVAVISQEEQQSEFAKATVDFLNGLPARTRI